ncbi:hypothetical protein [Photobacterium leiognathi]|uniref:hypothetical protein n=1 Tax=Photobacterium leiognathi TaxID=553611 RepID=UPI00298199AF|nr:hypothetical protein [Photobacterium leiognathi]
MNIADKLESHRFRCWGLRGDPLLWEFFKETVKRDKCSTVIDVKATLEKVFLMHIGHPLTNETLVNYSVIYKKMTGSDLAGGTFSGLPLLPGSSLRFHPRNRGMSASMVSLRFWLDLKDKLEEILN